MNVLEFGSRAYRLVLACIILAGTLYAALYFNYFQTPSEDYIGNFRPRIAEYMAGDFPGKNFKILPIYPLLVALGAKINPLPAHDVIYLTAMILNLLLYVPFLLVAHAVFKRFLSPRMTLAALAYLVMNVYSVFTAVNAELEMALALLTAGTVLLALRGSPASYAGAFLASAVKWDSVFAIPAAMYRDFFENRRRLRAILLGLCAVSGVAAWFALSLVNSGEYGNPYVKEIAQRGPATYRYIVDCFLILAGFVPWMATGAYFSGSTIVKAAYYPVVVAFTLFTVVSAIWGVAVIARNRLRENAPLLIFFAGYLAIHMIYQNTKERYVTPILWLLVLFMFYGIENGLAPWIKRMFIRRATAFRALAIAACLITALAMGRGLVLVPGLGLPLTVAACCFVALWAVIIVKFGGSDTTRARAFLFCTAAAAALLAVSFGVNAMDHYGWKRVEFRKAAEWFSAHARPGDRMLIAETVVSRYYSDMDESRFLGSLRLRSLKLDDLVSELAEKKVTYVFVDDFYVRRLQYGDKNAIDRKAHLFKEIRDRGESTGHFRQVEKFETRGGIVSGVYEFIP
ncbi:MAG: hypothetical protein EPN93_13865 [Spirochaetes bacterium]|nr:MAG: hypothetical protein EPN93_13865 [Spirochaetota bacterium]